MIGQDLVDFYDPSLMFAIPRLAIVYGLLICAEGPLNVDRSHSDFPSLFLPFKNLLRKIRELLQTLEPSEVMVLELLLCQLEEPANIGKSIRDICLKKIELVHSTYWLYFAVMDRVLPRLIFLILFPI